MSVAALMNNDVLLLTSFSLHAPCALRDRVESVSASLRVLEESCLVPFLQQLLENDSLLDVDRHASLYTSVFKVGSDSVFGKTSKIRCVASGNVKYAFL